MTSVDEEVLQQRRREVWQLFWWMLVAGTRVIVLQIGRVAMFVEGVIAVWQGAWLAAAFCLGLIALITWALMDP